MDQRHLGGKGRLAGRTAGLILLLASMPAFAGIYQWRDSSGHVHFGDEPPANAAASDISRQYDYKLPFNLVFHTVHYALPPKLKDRLSSAVQKIFSIYKTALGINYDPHTDFRITIYGNKREFQRYQRKVAPSLENPIGFYMSANHEITALGVDNTYAMAGLITHECTHAVLGEGDHYVPIWLNEGLAEYFSRIQVYGLGAWVPVAPHWLAVLRRYRLNNAAAQLRGLVNASPPAWRAADGYSHVSYALSWSLVYYLMGSKQGRNMISGMLKESRFGSRPFVDSAGYIDDHWPGGLPALATAWREWLPHASGKQRY